MPPSRRMVLIARRWCSCPSSAGRPRSSETPRLVPKKACSMSCVARALPAKRTLRKPHADQLADVFAAAGVDDGRAEHGQDLLAGLAGALHGGGDLAHRRPLGLLAGDGAGHELEQALPGGPSRRGRRAGPCRPTTMAVALACTCVIGRQRAVVRLRGRRGCRSPFPGRSTSIQSPPRRTCVR